MQIITRRSFLKSVGAAALVAALPTVSGIRVEQTVLTSHVINVPYYSQQTNNWCGEACTQMLLKYLNPQALLPSQSELAKEFDPDNPSRGNTPPTAMVADLQSRGYAQTYFQQDLNIDTLKKLISSEIPIVCRGGFDGYPTHLIVVLGYDDRDPTKSVMIANDPSTQYGGAGVRWESGAFDKLWTKGILGIGQRNSVVVPYKDATYIPPP